MKTHSRLGTGISSDASHGYTVSSGVFGAAYVKGSLALSRGWTYDSNLFTAGVNFQFR